MTAVTHDVVTAVTPAVVTTEETVRVETATATDAGEGNVASTLPKFPAASPPPAASRRRRSTPEWRGGAPVTGAVYPRLLAPSDAQSRDSSRRFPEPPRTSPPMTSFERHSQSGGACGALAAAAAELRPALSPTTGDLRPLRPMQIINYGDPFEPLLAGTSPAVSNNQSLSGPVQLTWV